MVFQISSIYGITNNESKQYQRHNSQLITDKVVNVKADSQGGVWFGTHGGGVVHIDKSGKWKVYKKDLHDLKNNYIKCLEVDSQGNKYIGTNEGVSALLKNNKWSNYYLNANKMQAEYVTCLEADNKGGLWHGIMNYGVYYKDSKGQWTKYNSDNSQLPSDNVRAMATDNKGGIWFATHPTYEDLGGIAYLDKDGKWTIYNDKNSKIPSNRVNHVYVAKDGSLWVSTINGLAQFSNNNWKIYQNKTMLEYDVRKVIEDKNGNIYASTWGNGIIKIDKAGKLVTYKEANSPLPKNYINDIDFDTQGNLWVATNDGITLIKHKVNQTSQNNSGANNHNNNQNTKITVYVNNKLLQFDSEPIMKDNRTLVPMRFIFEALNQKVEWVQSEKKVKSTGTKSIEFVIGEKAGKIDGINKVMDVPSQIVKGRTMVPLRWVAEALDLSVKWDGNIKRIDIMSK
jgi:ligand-binding sensor domain-containing protein